jgi:hypothetical protein
MAVSAAHPPRTRRPSTCADTTQRGSSAHAAITLVSPKAVMCRLVRRLRACSFGVIHRQFSGEYPRSLSMRSMVSPSPNPLATAQSRNGTYSCHSAQTVIPLRPYPPQLLDCSSAQRCFIPAQTFQSLVPTSPCLKFAAEVFSFCRQPHDFVLPLRRLASTTSVLSPQSHLHRTISRLRVPRPMSRSTIRSRP